MFDEEELKTISGFTKGSDFIDVTCGCTSKKYGDTIGRLRVYSHGQFVIYCNCSSDCQSEEFTPYDFEKHSGRGGATKWTSHIWVMMEEKKVPLWKTELLKYYKHASNDDNAAIRARVKRRIFHRDEFIRCARCKKERRFRLRNKEECRVYHDALLMKRWKCTHYPYDKINCDADEERASRKSCRGCPRAQKCNGCPSCVCFGCLKCRFRDCNCRTCVDFMQNAAP